MFQQMGRSHGNASADVNASVRLQLVRERLVARQAECSLPRHLDSVGPDTPIRDLVDSCRVWESHAQGIPSVGLPGPECTGHGWCRLSRGTALAYSVLCHVFASGLCWDPCHHSVDTI